MADIKSINGNPIVVGTSGIEDGAVTDAKLASDGIVGDIDYISSVLRKLAPLSMVKKSELTDGKTIDYRDGVMRGPSESFCATADYVDISGCDKIAYTQVLSTTTGTMASGMAFYDSEKTYISGVQHLRAQPSGGAVLNVVDVPENAEYARFSYWMTDSQHFEEMPFAVYDFAQMSETLTYDFEELADYVDEFHDEYDMVYNNIVDYRQYDLRYVGTVPYIISGSSLKWINTNSPSSYLIRRPDRSIAMTIVANEMNRSTFALLKSSDIQVNTVPDYATGSGRTVIEPNETMRVIFPDDCEYIAVHKTWSSNDYTPQSLTIEVVDVAGSDLADTPPIGLHVIPESEGVLNVVRRCRQMTDIRWTPAVNIPRIAFLNNEYSGDGTTEDNDFEDVFLAGVEYKGIPYSRANRGSSSYGYSNFFVGMFVDFEAFVTSARNEHSALCTLSQYNMGNNRAGYFGAVCSALACYAYGLDRYYETATMHTIPGMTLIGRLISEDTGERMDASQIKLGDALIWRTHHTGIVTDIISDSDGEVKAIEISEATLGGSVNWDVRGGKVGGLCRRKFWPVDEFFKWFQSYSLYRYSTIDDVTYTPSPFVDTGDEGDSIRYEDMPCIPFLGNGFKYKHGYIVNSEILIGITGFGYLAVFKDGQPWNADGSSDRYEVSGTSVDVGFEDVGEYTAYLCNVSGGVETNKTRACHWSVIE